MTRDRLSALAAELRDGTPPQARRCYQRAFDDGTTIELVTEAATYPAPNEAPIEAESGEDSAWVSLQASWSSAFARAAEGGEEVGQALTPSEERRRRRRWRRRHRRFAEEMTAPVTVAETHRPAVASTPNGAGATARREPEPAEPPPLDPEVLRKDLEGLAPASPTPPPAPPAVAPAPPKAEPSPPPITHEVFDRLRQGRAGEALAAMKSASKSASPSQDVFDRFPRGLVQPMTYDVGTFEVKQRFDEFDRRLAAADSPQPAPASPDGDAGEDGGAPALLPFDLREDLEQLRAQARPPQEAPVTVAPGAPAEHPTGAKP
jgi:hypothetical protein